MFARRELSWVFFFFFFLFRRVLWSYSWASPAQMRMRPEWHYTWQVWHFLPPFGGHMTPFSRLKCLGMAEEYELLGVARIVFLLRRGDPIFPTDGRCFPPSGIEALDGAFTKVRPSLSAVLGSCSPITYTFFFPRRWVPASNTRRLVGNPPPLVHAAYFFLPTTP